MRLVAVFTVLAAVAIATIVVWLTFFRHPQETVVREKPGGTIVVAEPTLTPLRDSIRESKRSQRSPTQRSTAAAPRTTGQNRNTPSPARIQPSAPSRRPKTTPQRRRPSSGSGGGSTTQPSPPPQGQPQPAPQPVLTVPLPSVCLPPVKVGQC